MHLLSVRTPALAIDTIERLYAESELWIGNQVRKENETGIRMDDDEFCRNILSIYRNELHFDDDIEPEMLSVVSGKYEKNYKLMSGAYETLDFLQKANVKMGIVSNNYSRVRNALYEIGLDEYFQCIIISEEVGLSKPDPEILRLACESIGVDNTEAIYIGDHPFDILCAHSASMDICWLRQNKHLRIPEYIGSPEYSIDNLIELKNILTL